MGKVVPQPCSGARRPDRSWEDCGELVVGNSKCPKHRTMTEATRRPPARQRGYGKHYEAKRVKVLAPDPVTGQPPRCALRLPGCTTWATTANHRDPVNGGRNLAVVLDRDPDLEPACAHCNSALGNRGRGPAREPTGQPENPENPDGWFPPP